MSAKLLKPDAVAIQLEVPRTRVVRWCKAGKIDAVRIGRFWRVPKAELDRVLKEGTRQLENRVA